jgi:hypothetical protein
MKSDANIKEIRAKFDAVSKSLSNRRGSQGGAGDEAVYALLYQELVKLGVYPQIRKKYRVR